MSNSVQDPSATANQAVDTPVGAQDQIEKGKGKATEEAMDDDEDDDDESGEVSLSQQHTPQMRIHAHAQAFTQKESTLTQRFAGHRRRASRGTRR